MIESAPSRLNIPISVSCMKLLLASAKTITQFCLSGVLGFVVSRRYHDIADLIREEIKRRKASPPSLRDLCKATVRGCLGSVGLHRKIYRLPLPRPLLKDLRIIYL